MSGVAGVQLQVEQEGGSGRTLLVLREQGRYEALARATATAAQARNSVVALEVPHLSHRTFEQTLSALHELLKNRSLRQASWIAFGAATSLVQQVAIFTPKLVRAAVLVDAATRAHPTRFEQFISKIERWLPLGLPLRQRTLEFDAQPFLHRMRCPVLLVQSPESSELQRQSAAELTRYAPTAWSTHLTSNDHAAELCQLVEEFSQVPARAPQKNVARGA